MRQDTYECEQVCLMFESVFEWIARETGYTCVNRSDDDPVYVLLDESGSVVASASYDKPSWSDRRELSFTFNVKSGFCSEGVDSLADFPLKFTKNARIWLPMKPSIIQTTYLQVRDVTLKEISENTPIVLYDLDAAMATKTDENS